MAAFGDNIFNCIFWSENVWIPRGPINNIPALVQNMAWRQAIIWTNAEILLIIWTNGG